MSTRAGQSWCQLKLRPPVNSDAETGNKLLPQNSDLKEAEKDQHDKRSPLEMLSRLSVFVTSTMLLIGDSVIQFDWA